MATVRLKKGFDINLVGAISDNAIAAAYLFIQTNLWSTHRATGFCLLSTVDVVVFNYFCGK